MEQDYEKLVRTQVEKLTRCTTAEIQTRVAQKRLAWLEEKFPGTSLPIRLTPRGAFELLFFDYMGLDPHNLEVIEESEDQIVWISRNPCPTLGACAALGLDTRVVCRAAYEKSTQAFLSRLDPQLRFLRNYQEIRPYADGCKESIVRLDFTAMLAACWSAGSMAADRQTGNTSSPPTPARSHTQGAPEGVRGGSKKAKLGIFGGERPRKYPESPIFESFTSPKGGEKGAVVALGKRILARESDADTLGEDPGSHVEARAIRQAAQALDDANLSGAILFVTQRPCPACFSLAEETNLAAIAFPSSGEGSKTGRMIGPLEIVESWSS